jgi:cell division protein FtsZ
MGVRQLVDRPMRIEKLSNDDEEIKAFVEKRRTQIRVVGCGGAGNNTLTRLAQVGITGAETIAVNADAMDLLYTDADKKIVIGKEITQGLGAGANPTLGAEAAKESKEEIKKALQGADMVFLTCGLGGGTGTGSIPVVADIAKKLGALTVAIVTLPFKMEGRQRALNAREGLKNLEGVVDTLIIIPNDKLLELVPDVSITTAFKICDEILVNSVKGITELVTKPGLVNLDFADVKAVMREGGMAMIGMGESDTENRAFESVEKALNNPLLSVDIEGAEGALINVIGGPDITIREAQQIAEEVSSKLSSEAKIIWGVQVDKSLGDVVRTMVVITGVKSSEILGLEKTLSRDKKKDIEKILGVDFVE